MNKTILASFLMELIIVPNSTNSPKHSYVNVQAAQMSLPMLKTDQQLVYFPGQLSLFPRVSFQISYLYHTSNPITYLTS